jgi:acyl-coenzyme A thioesterase PaaI-like protein
MKATYKLIDKLLENPTKLNVMALDRLLMIGIPFNAPHGLRIKTISGEEVRISLPNRRLNHNHLGGIHACAMATVGEYCAGMSLLSSFGISKYRLIMSEMNVTYTYQGRRDLEGFCDPRQIDKEAIQNALNSDGKYSQRLETIVREEKGHREVARVVTHWQLKNWDQVKTKD